ncbi:hypothetical protein [Nannocystis punicea]|uniref:Minor tail protein n=1 Tax=Nannocystis punicea TaxID=2995304 RepID=A0ABY7GX79_9BACT|nr:hypothetical protein [Nannocystis poenicansa]WAS91589.1 hypothetical protein O0S08_35865 [Nannocystis poenicansa]
MTDISSNSKPDTALLLDAFLSDHFIDHSQYHKDVVEQDLGPTHWLAEASSARTAINGSREISLLWKIQSGQTGVLIDHGSSSTTYSYRIDVTSGNLVRCRYNNSTVVSANLPGVVAATDHTFLISWCQHPSAPNYRSELYIYNLTLGGANFVFTTGQHLVVTASPTDTLSIGAGFGGSSPFAGGTDFNQVRIGRRFHSTTEQWEDWISQRKPPDMTQLRRSPPLVPDRATLDIADEGSLVGPAHLWSGHAYEQADRRLLGSLVNTRVYDPLRITNTFAPAAWWRTAPGDTAVRLCTTLLWCRPVPRKVNFAHVRLFVRQTIEFGANTAEVRYRCYSIAGLPVLNEAVGPLTFHRTAAATCNTPHGTNAGEWLDLGALPLAVDDLGMTWLAVGIEFDETNPALASDTSAFVRAITIDPYFEQSGGGGLDIQDP